MSSSITQLSCFFSINNNRRFLTRSYPFSTHFRPIKILNITSGDGITNFENSKTSASYKEDPSTIHNGNSVKSSPAVGNFDVDGLMEKKVVSQPKKGAKIHDFCFGIPFGGLVLSGGLLGFIFSRNPATLGTGVLFGGALLALSTFSLKVWRQGKSSLPFILGQAVLAVALLSKNLKAYSLTQKLFPTGFNVLISAAMFCFYCYVVISGGNPPPKKKTPSAAAAATS